MAKIHEKLAYVRLTIRSGKDSKNSFGGYDYRNAEKMLSIIKPNLAKYGLTIGFSDSIEMVGDRHYIKSTCTVTDITDGESHSVTSWAREPQQKKGMDESQITGSAMTYAHKYALMSMMAISDPTLDPDYHSGVYTQNAAPAQAAPTQTTQKAQRVTPPPAPAPRAAAQAQTTQMSYGYGGNASRTNFSRN